MNFTTKLCPFCNQDNKCDILNAKSCWCMKEKVPTSLQELVPKEHKRKSCICQNCVLEYKKDEVKFKQKNGFI